MDLMDDELRRVLSGSVDAPTDSMARELDRLRVRDRGPTVTERAAASQPSFRMPSSGRRRPEQRGGGEALETLGSAIAGSVPAGLAGLAVLPFQGPEGAGKMVERVQDYLTIDPQTEGGVRALRGIAGALSPLGAPAQAAGDLTLRATGYPLLATGAELLADPLNLLGIGATAKPIARGAAAAGRGAAKAAKATGQNLGPKVAELAESYMQRTGMAPQIFVGKSSKTWDAASNARAAEMEAAGIPPQTIWRETGNWRAPDGQWRQEISDAGVNLPRIANPITEAERIQYQKSVRRSEQIDKEMQKIFQRKNPDHAKIQKLKEESSKNSEFQIDFRNRAKGIASAKLGEVFPHEDLFAAYPQFQNLKVTDYPSEKQGSALIGKLEMLINPQARNREGIAIHELQHFIQDLEGFSPGGESKEYLKDTSKRLQELYKERDEALRPAKERGYYTEEEKAKLYEFVDRESALSPFGQYLRLMGEAESRAAEARMNLTPEERRAKFPEESYDVPIGELIDAPRTGRPAFAIERGDVTRMTTPELEAEAASLSVRVNQAYESGNQPLAERLDARLESVFDALEHRFSEVEEDGVVATAPGRREEARYVAGLDEDSGDPEADLVRDLANRWKDMTTPGSFDASLSDAEKAANIRMLLDDYSFRHGGLREGLSDQQFLDAAKDAYESVFVRKAQRQQSQGSGEVKKASDVAFKQFTGGAPVVSLGSASKHEFQTGKPVVIEGLHGTKFDFAEIDPARSSAGYFMTDRPVVADEYAGVYPEGRGGGHFPTGGNVQRTFVRMDNPLFVNARGASFNRLDTRGVPGFGLPMSNTDMLNQWAKQQGYDGVIYKDLRDSISAPGGGNAPASNVFVSFKPNYVKSATGNRGTYDIQQRDMTKADGGLIGETMSYTTAADIIADKLMRQGMDPDQAFMTALRMSDARMKAGGAVLMAGGGDTERELTLQARNRNLAALDRALAPRARKTWDGPMIDRPIVNGKALVSAEELADFRRRFGEKMTLRDLLNADKGRGPSGAMPAARGAQGANVAPRGPLIRPDEAATLPPVGLSDIPGLVMRGMAEGAERVPAGRGAGAAFMGAALPRALSAGTTAAKTLRDHPSISPERRQMLKEMEDYISGLNQADRPAVDPKMRALEERLEPRMQVGGPAVKLTARAAARAEARLAEKAAKEAAERAAKQAAIDARTEDEKSVLEKFGQKKKQEAARTKKVREMEEKIDVPVSPKRTVASSYSAVPPDIYRQMEAQLGPDAVMKAVEAGHHLKPTPSGYVGAPRTVTNQQSLGAMRRAMDKDFADSVQAVRVADPERLGTWYDRAKLGIAESSTPSQLDRTLEQHGVYSAGVSPESELGFALKHLNSRVAGEPAMAYRGAPMRTLDEAVAQGIPANMGFKIGEYMNKNDPRIPNAGLFGVNDFRRAQGMGYTDPAGEPWRAGVTDTMHPFMDAETALQVGRSNRDKIGGRSDWAGPHIQELPWVYGKGQDLYSRGETGRFAGDELAGIKQALVEANNTARDYMYKHAGSSTHEAIPGASTGHVPQMITAPLADRLKYTETGRWDRPMPEMPLPDAPGVGAGLRDVIYSALGFRQLPSVRASGAFFPEGATVPEHQPVTIARPLLDFPTGGGAEISTPTRQTLDFAERFRALMDAQEAFGYNLPNTMGAIPGKNAVVLDTRSRNPNKLKEPHTGPRPDEQQMASLTKLLEDTGYGIAPTSRGATIFPFSPTSSTSDIKKLLKEKGAEIQSIFPSEFDLSKNTMGYGPGVGIYTPEGFKASEPFSGQATTALLKEASLLPENVARNLSESEAVRTAIKEKSARDAPLAGARSDIQETRRFFGGEDWAKAVDMIRKGMTPAAALAALGYSSLSMAEEASR